ncbi:MAG TPA: DUF6064 family protein [Ramlibacter sp.]
MLPFTREQFLEVFARYNEAVWPVQALAVMLGLAACVAVLRPGVRRGRVVTGVLAAMWLWTGVLYHWTFFAAINPVARVFAAAFVLQGVLLAWTAWRGSLQFGRRDGAARWLGWGLILYSLAVYPAIGAATGHVYPRAPMFGITPCPVTLFTCGALLLATTRVPGRLLAVPIAWSLVGGSAAWLLRVPQDWPLLVGAAAGVAVLLRRRPASP